MIHPMGTLPISQRHRVSQISFHPSEPYIAIQSHERSIEVFSIRTEEEIKKKRARRRQRAREKSKKKSKGEPDGMNMEVAAGLENEPEEEEVGLTDLFSSYLVVRASEKVRSFDFVNADVRAKGGIQVCLLWFYPSFTFNFPSIDARCNE